MFYWFLKHVAIGPIVRVVFRPRSTGVEHVPRRGGAILASNHLAASDWIFMPLVLRRRVTFLAKAEYFTAPGVKGFLQRIFFGGSGQVPIDRTSADAAENALSTGIRILGEGKLLGIYPEGTRSPDGRLFRGKTGVARMTLETGCPVVPVAMVPGRSFRLLGRTLTRVDVVVGEPLDFSRYEGMSGDRFVERSITDEIMYEIMSLSDQEYVDMYATRAKQVDKEREREAKKAADAGPDAAPGDGPEARVS